MFKEGDLITGKDQSYERSIYKFIREINEDEPKENFPNWIKPSVKQNPAIKYPLTLLEPVSFHGIVFKDSEKYIILHESVSKFRLATQEEIERSKSGPTDYKKRDEWLGSTHK